MTVLRQFISAPSLARLIQKERGGERVLEGYFPALSCLDGARLAM
jgi:hypothetical protein